MIFILIITIYLNVLIKEYEVIFLLFSCFFYNNNWITSFLFKLLLCVFFFVRSFLNRKNCNKLSGNHPSSSFLFILRMCDFKCSLSFLHISYLFFFDNSELFLLCILIFLLLDQTLFSIVYY
jgi:hypothetical protein